MRLQSIVLSVVFALCCQFHCNNVYAATVSELTTLAQLTSPEDLRWKHSVSTGKQEGLSRRHLRARGVENGSRLKNDEERIGALEALGMVAKGIKTKTQTKIWLARGVSPASVLKKLKVASKEDPNFKIYSKYYFKFMVRYPDKIPTNLPASLAEDIVKARMHDWLHVQKLTPPQVFTNELKLTGSFESARGHPNYQYFERYYKMWRDEQERLSRADIQFFRNNYVRNNN